MRWGPSLHPPGSWLRCHSCKTESICPLAWCHVMLAVQSVNTASGSSSKSKRISTAAFCLHRTLDIRSRQHESTPIQEEVVAVEPEHSGPGTHAVGTLNAALDTRPLGQRVSFRLQQNEKPRDCWRRNKRRSRSIRSSSLHSKRIWLRWPRQHFSHQATTKQRC